MAAGITVAAYVPDTRLQGVLSLLATGQRIAGKRPVVLMQSSGLGNSLNALGSRAVPYRLGLPRVVSMRGALGEANPSQVPR